MVVEELVPEAFHHTEAHANNRIEADHGCLKARLRPMRGLKRDRSAQLIISGHAFMQNLRRGHYDSLLTPVPAAASLPRSPNSPKRSEEHRRSRSRAQIQHNATELIVMIAATFLPLGGAAPGLIEQSARFSCSGS
jgi:DDE domain